MQIIEGKRDKNKTKARSDMLSKLVHFTNVLLVVHRTLNVLSQLNL